MSGASAAGPIADAAVADLQSLERVLERDLMRLLTRLDTDSGKDTLARRQLQNAAAVLRQVQARMVLEGVAVRGVIGQRAAQAVQAVMGEDAIPADIRAELDLIVRERTADVVKVFRDVVEPMRQAVSRGIISGASLGDVISEVAERMQTAYFRAQAAVDAAIMAVGRRAIWSSAQASGLDLVYVYVGPKDAKNRPFCQQWVGKAATNPATLNNGQDLPAEDYCGGYNCRHSWAPTLREDAVAQGIVIVRT